MKKLTILVVSLFLLLVPFISFAQEEEPQVEETIVAETDLGSIPNYAADPEDQQLTGDSLVRGLINQGVIPEDQEDEFNAGRGFAVYPSTKSPADSPFSLGVPGRPEKPQAPGKPIL